MLFLSTTAAPVVSLPRSFVLRKPLSLPVSRAPVPVFPCTQLHIGVQDTFPPISYSECLPGSGAVPDTKPDLTLTEQRSQIVNRVLSAHGRCYEGNRNTKMKSLGDLGEKRPLETVFGVDLLIKEPLCSYIKEIKEQARNNLGDTSSQKTLTEEEAKQAEGVWWGGKPESSLLECLEHSLATASPDWLALLTQRGLPFRGCLSPRASSPSVTALFTNQKAGATMKSCPPSGMAPLRVQSPETFLLTPSSPLPPPAPLELCGRLCPRVCLRHVPSLSLGWGDTSVVA